MATEAAQSPTSHADNPAPTKDRNRAPKPPDVTSEWDGHSWVVSPDPKARWNGSQWLMAPVGEDARWDGTQWVTRPRDGRHEWGHDKWLPEPRGPVTWDERNQRWQRPVWLRPWFVAGAVIVIAVLIWQAVGFIQSSNDVSGEAAAGQVQGLIRSQINLAEDGLPSSLIVNGAVAEWKSANPDSDINVYASGRIAKIDDPASEIIYCVEVPMTVPPDYQPTVRPCR